MGQRRKHRRRHPRVGVAPAAAALPLTPPAPVPAPGPAPAGGGGPDARERGGLARRLADEGAWADATAALDALPPLAPGDPATPCRRVARAMMRAHCLERTGDVGGADAAWREATGRAADDAPIALRLAAAAARASALLARRNAGGALLALGDAVDLWYAGGCPLALSAPLSLAGEPGEVDPGADFAAASAYFLDGPGASLLRSPHRGRLRWLSLVATRALPWHPHAPVPDLAGADEAWALAPARQFAGLYAGALLGADRVADGVRVLLGTAAEAAVSAGHSAAFGTLLDRITSRSDAGRDPARPRPAGGESGATRPGPPGPEAHAEAHAETYAAMFAVARRAGREAAEEVWREVGPAWAALAASDQAGARDAGARDAGAYDAGAHAAGRLALHAATLAALDDVWTSRAAQRGASDTPGFTWDAPSGDAAVAAMALAWYDAAWRPTLVAGAHWPELAAAARATAAPLRAPDDPAADADEGWARFEMGDWAGAEAACRAALARADDPEIAHRLGLACWQQGRPGDALVYLRQAQGARPDAAR